MTPTTSTTHRRLTASARRAGQFACEFCHPRVCERCGALQPCHVTSVYTGGHGYDLLTACHDDAGCRQRRGL